MNTSSPDLDITRGAVSRSILRAAGDELKKEIARFPVIKHGSSRVRVEYGDVVETMGHGLKCKRIFHGTLCKWNDDKVKSQDVSIMLKIIMRERERLQNQKKKKIKSIEIAICFSFNCIIKKNRNVTKSHVIILNYSLTIF